MRKILAGIDLGSDTLKLVVGEYFKGRVNVLAVATVPSKGINSGFVTNPNELIMKLRELFKKGEELIGLPITKVIATIPSNDVKFHMNEGYTTIEEEIGMVRSIDIIRSMQASAYNQVEDNEEIATIMPIHFKVDDEKVLEPIGKQGKKCSVKTIFTTVPKKNVIPIVKCLNKIGVEVIDTTFSALGDYYEIENKDTKTQVGAIINLGHMTTNVSIFNKGILTNTTTIQMGAMDIEKDIAYMFKVPKKEARDIRLNLCLAHKRNVSDLNKKEYTNKDGEKITVNEYEATEIASSRIEEILKIAKKEINYLTKKEIHYIIITGGISEMANFSYLMEEVFGHYAKLCVTKEVGLRSNIYSTSVGLIKYYLDKMHLRNQEFTIFNYQQLDELSGTGRKMNINENSILGKIFGYFFDN